MKNQTTNQIEEEIIDKVLDKIRYGKNGSFHSFFGSQNQAIIRETRILLKEIQALQKSKEDDFIFELAGELHFTSEELELLSKLKQKHQIGTQKEVSG